jgi:DNA-binding MarR family transcriptional regulator/GNAT superfamily N-acetyltransferase
MHPHHIHQVRSFNRTITQCTGALEHSYLRRGRPLGEARLLFEAGTGHGDIAALRTRLGLDSGYLSRLLRALEAQGLVSVRRLARDGRRRQVELTAAGQAEFTAYEALSDDLARALLAPLSPRQRDRLVAAMAEVERLVQAAGIDLRQEAPDSDAARSCLDRYFHELAQRFESGFDPGRSNPATEAEMTPPRGWFVVAWLGDRPVGCGALKRGDQGIGEIKRMWTAPDARSLGIARRILHWLEAKARDVGLHTLRLETNRTLREAQALYRQEGFQDVAPFNDELYAHYWFEKHLQPRPSEEDGRSPPSGTAAPRQARRRRPNPT